MTDDEKILEFCGIDETSLPCLIIECEKERGVHCITWGHLLYPEIDLKFLFKEVAPKLGKVTLDYQGGGCTAWLALKGKKAIAQDKDPAEAFKQALMELMEEDK